MTLRLKTYPAFATVRLPQSATILDVQDRGSEQAAALVVQYDDADPYKTERHFVTLRAGDAIPDGARFVASWRELDTPAAGIVCLFERVPVVEVTPCAHRWAPTELTTVEFCEKCGTRRAWSK